MRSQIQKKVDSIIERILEGLDKGWGKEACAARDEIIRAFASNEKLVEAADSAYSLLVEFSDLSSWQNKDYGVMKKLEKAISAARPQ